MPTELFNISPNAPRGLRDDLDLMSAYLDGTFTHDTSIHDWLIDARGKGRMSVAVDTTNASTYTIQVYGRHNLSTDGPSAVGAFFISEFTSPSSGGYEAINDPFPYYLVRVQSSDTVSGSTGQVRVFANLIPGAAGGNVKSPPKFGTYTAMISAATLQSTTNTSCASNALDVSGARELSLFLDMDATAGNNSSGFLGVALEFANASGSTYYAFAVGPLAALNFSSTSVDTGFKNVYDAPVISQFARVRLNCTSTGVFTVSAFLQTRV